MDLDVYFHKSNSNNSKGLVLVIEDSLETGNAIAELLHSYGYESEVVGNVTAAINFLTQKTPDLILSDINLPEHSGSELFNETRRNSIWSEIPFIFISGVAGADLKHNSLSAGADDFLHKPIVPVELKASIEGRLKQYKSRKHNEKSRFENFRKRIIHTLSHEFRTPLVSITTGTELLLDEYKGLNDDQVETLLRSILKGGQRLERLVEDFMIMQQIDIGYAAKSFDQFKCKLSVSELVDLLNIKLRDYVKMQYPNAQLEIAIEPAAELKTMQLYPDQVIDSLFRFIDNGLKFSAPRSKVTVNISSDDNYCVFNIRDWGSGIDDTTSARLKCVKPFEQLNRDIYEQQGCGLGLSIASYFMSLHSAELTIAKAEDGKGTNVHIKMPLD